MLASWSFPEIAHIACPAWVCLPTFWVTEYAVCAWISRRVFQTISLPRANEVLQVLRDMQEDPKSAQRHLQHPDISAKIEKLVAAGIIQVR